MIHYRLEGMATAGVLRATKRRANGRIFPLWHPEDHIHLHGVAYGHLVSVSVPFASSFLCVFSFSAVYSPRSCRASEVVFYATSIYPGIIRSLISIAPEKQYTSIYL